MKTITPDLLLSCIGDIDPVFVENAERKVKTESQTAKTRPARIWRFVPVGACAALVLALVIVLPHINNIVQPRSPGGQKPPIESVMPSDGSDMSAESAISPPGGDYAPCFMVNDKVFWLSGHTLDELPDGYVEAGTIREIIETQEAREGIGLKNYQAGFGNVGDKIYLNPDSPETAWLYTDLYSDPDKFHYVFCKTEEGRTQDLSVFTDPITEASFKAKIVEIESESVIVEPLEGEIELTSPNRKRIRFSTNGFDDIGASVGDIVTITFMGGSITESYPAGITATGWAIVEKANPHQ